MALKISPGRRGKTTPETVIADQNLCQTKSHLALQATRLRALGPFSRAPPPPLARIAAVLMSECCELALQGSQQKS